MDQIDFRSSALRLLPGLSGLWLSAGVVVIAGLTPDYSHVSQFMSVLGAQGAPFADWANYAVFGPAEAAMLVFLVVLWAALPKGSAAIVTGLALLALYACLLVAAAFLPCDAGCHAGVSGASASHRAHMVIGALAYPLALIGLLLLCLSLPGAGSLRLMGLLASVCGFGLFLTMLSVTDLQGLTQRLLEAIIYVQAAVLGWRAASLRQASGSSETAHHGF
ncbi:DUF998 domain-containing protein [Roseibium sp.]|uniref:DUF998 domain-containing protein n=1 Tax=Roseibium sp. TaxID=1936156 RepID=UPI003A97B8C3